MTKYEFISSQKNNLKIFSMMGLTSSVIFRHLEIYEFYINMSRSTKMQKYEDTAEEFKMQPRRIMGIIKEMEGEINLPPGSKISNITITQ